MQLQHRSLIDLLILNIIQNATFT